MADHETLVKEALQLAKPPMVEQPDLAKLREVVQEYIDAVDALDEEDLRDGAYKSAERIETDIFCEAVQAYFGKDVYEKYINKRMF